MSNVPAWRLEWLRERLMARGARKVPDTRVGMRALHDVYMLAFFGRKRRLKKAIDKAGAHGTLAAQLGEEHKP